MNEHIALPQAHPTQRRDVSQRSLAQHHNTANLVANLHHPEACMSYDAWVGDGTMVQDSGTMDDCMQSWVLSRRNLQDIWCMSVVKSCMRKSDYIDCIYKTCGPATLT